MKKIFKPASSFALTAFFVAPLFAFAQSGINSGPISLYSNGIISIINYSFVPLLIAVAFIVFLYGVYKYFILGADDEKNRAEGRQFVLWGVIGFVIILAVWGLVAVVRNTFGLTTGNAPKPPTFNTPASQLYGPGF